MLHDRTSEIARIQLLSNVCSYKMHLTWDHTRGNYHDTDGEYYVGQYIRVHILGDQSEEAMTAETT